MTYVRPKLAGGKGRFDTSPARTAAKYCSSQSCMDVLTT